MIDYFLKFPDEATANAVLEPFIQTHAIDVIGVIYKPTGIMIDDGALEMGPIIGWHVNVRGPQTNDFTQYEIMVETPVRVWA